MQALDFSLWSRRPNENSWSANDCAQHLNMYFDFYLPEIKKRLKNAPKRREKTSVLFCSAITLRKACFRKMSLIP